MCGGFLYLNEVYDIVAVNSFFFEEVNEDTRAKKITSVLTLSQNKLLPEISGEALQAWDRFQPVTVPWLKELGYTDFAWVCPSEILGDWVSPTGGGFAYLNEDKTKSLFAQVGDHTPSINCDTSVESQSSNIFDRLAASLSQSFG